jgi:predicted metal-dependent hydrolase
MNQYNPVDTQKKIREVADVLSAEYKLNLKRIDFIVNERLYGQCSPDGYLKIKLQYPDGELIPLMEAWRTLAHEMAHLKHGNHGDEFWMFNRDLCLRISELIGKKIRPEIAFLSNRKVVY